VDVIFLVLLSIETDSSHIGPNGAYENIKASFMTIIVMFSARSSGVPFLTRSAYIRGGAFSTPQKAGEISIKD
jgi:hypothetical protein